MRFSRKQIGVMVSLISLTAVNVFATANAQNGYQPPTKRPINRAWGSQPVVRTEQPLEFRATNLDREVSLPNLPGYTGKQQFISGLMYPNAKDGPGYYINYNTEHTQQQVRQWWTNALKIDPWKITFSDDTTIKAHDKNGSKCTITTGPVMTAATDKSKGMHGSYMLYFHISQKQK